MLSTEFYTITKYEEKDADTRCFQIKLNVKHAIYNGHFPAQPVLPGVCTVQIIKECAENIVNTPLQYSQLSSCKFLFSVDPTLCNEISLSVSVVSNEDKLFTISASGMYMDNTFIKLKAAAKTV